LPSLFLECNDGFAYDYDDDEMFHCSEQQQQQPRRSLGQIAE